MTFNWSFMLASALLLACLVLAQSERTQEAEANHQRTRRSLGGILAIEIFKPYKDEKDKKPPVTKFPHSSKELEAAVASYPITDDEKEFVKQKYDEEVKEPSKSRFESIAQIAAAKSNGGIKKEEEINAKVVDQLINDQKDIPTSADDLVVYRADGRDKKTLEEAGGFFGYAPVTIEHARILAKQWGNKDMMREWKGTTGKNGRTPFVAVGTDEPQKGGNVYKMSIPVKKKPGPCRVNPQVIHDSDDLKDAKIIGICYQGEIIFITGIPWKFFVF